MSDYLVDVWLIRTDLPEPALAELAEVLDQDERTRAAALAPTGRRAAFVASHAVARLVLGARLDVPPERLRWRRGRHGKPEIAWPATESRVNLSHSGDLAALAVADGRAVGVDIQRHGTDLDAVRLAARYYPAVEACHVAKATEPGERARRFARLWARKEACVKAIGGRLAEGLRLPVCEPVVPGPQGPHLVADLPAPQGFEAAVALAGTAPYRVVTRWWPAGIPVQPEARQHAGCRAQPETMVVQTCSTVASA
ncbi:4'-phosphopantetheinyl transferase superfamily protein [Solihabitans fulvus]|uniref:4'-phosphopantetheinyl transferase superfamily protein n=1 Tax=Solihabitans fulvus TaxID=1892852 RepID=A0A5B2WWM9_9PSEU|nr:4'-phosphopantetheinyl transferase superfamily protein [Solihabitans fulvus]KAA2255915.1 4'-phosphopantetheinyl transferase superfamily protein [Solihabitans fulvus]